MAFPKKGSRKILVNGRHYKWIASGNDGWINLYIAEEEFQGSKLIAKFDYHPVNTEYEDNQNLKQRFVVTSYIVKQVINYALTQGWNPGVKEKDLDLGQMDDKIDLRLIKS